MRALYRRYRPQRFEEVVGQDHVVKTLRRAIDSGRLGHAYLFCGPRGVGKTTVARLLAKAVNCTAEKNQPCGICKNCTDIAEGRFIDLIEIDAASNRGIDEMRDLREKIRFAPNIGKKKVYIIDEVHMLTREAFNALLKTLEEPPSHSLFIFATTEIHKVPQTIISRCQRFDFRLGDGDKVAEVVSAVAKKEKLKLTDEVSRLISRSSGGSYRDAQSLLDQISSHIIDQEIDLETAVTILNLSSKQDALDFIELLRQKEMSKAIESVGSLHGRGVRLEEFLADVISLLRAEIIESIKAGNSPLWPQKAAERLIGANAQLKISPIESLPIEMAIIDICSSVRADNDVSGKVTGGKKSESEKGQVEEKKIDGISPESTVVQSKPKTAIKSLSSSARQAFIEQVSLKNKPLGSLLSTAQMDYRDGVLKIFVEYPIHAAKIKSKNAVVLLEGILEEIVGSKTRIECEVCKEEDLSEKIEEVFEAA